MDVIQFSTQDSNNFFLRETELAQSLMRGAFLIDADGIVSRCLPAQGSSAGRYYTFALGRNFFDEVFPVFKSTTLLHHFRKWCRTGHVDVLFKYETGDCHRITVFNIHIKSQFDGNGCWIFTKEVCLN